jgi:23S rRNA (adenine-N6)-dimethyltransferase
VYKLRRKQLSQNFIYNRKLIAQLVGLSSISQNDRVLEIGPGKGLLTDELLKTSARVIAVELDEKLVLHLKQYLGHNENLTLIHQDALAYQLPEYLYKVFSNTPFAISGQIIRKLLDGPNPPDDCFLIVQQELAQRLSGQPRQNQFSISHQPWFDFSTLYYFKRSDFIPAPKVDSVLWRIRTKRTPLLPTYHKVPYQRFVKVGFDTGQPIGKSLASLYHKKDIQKACQELSISPHSKPSHLTLTQWINIYTSLSC